MNNTKPQLVERRFLVPFILITSLFALWGFANDITNPMVAAFQTLMELSAAKASLVQFAFYGGYATMAVPAALFIRKYSYKSGILLGLAAGTAAGFVGLFGYLLGDALLSKIVVGQIAGHSSLGWGVTFWLFIAGCVVATLICAVTWKKEYVLMQQRAAQH